MSSGGTTEKITLNMMIKKLLSLTLLLPISAACAVEYKVEDKTITPVEVEKTSWKCPDCSPEEQYVLAELQKHTKISDRNASARLWEISNRSLTFIPTYEGGA